MTKETIKQKAEEWFNNTVEKGLTAERGVVTTYCPNAIAGYIAGAKENGNQWHDIRKNPDDLPKDDMSEVAIITPSGEWEKGIFRRIDHECYWRIIGFNENVKVIAWCEIPTFDKE